MAVTSSSSTRSRRRPPHALSPARRPCEHVTRPGARLPHPATTPRARTLPHTAGALPLTAAGAPSHDRYMTVTRRRSSSPSSPRTMSAASGWRRGSWGSRSRQWGSPLSSGPSPCPRSSASPPPPSPSARCAVILTVALAVTRTDTFTLCPASSWNHHIITNSSSTRPQVIAKSSPCPITS